MYYSYLDTPIGELLLAGDDDVLCLVGFPEGSMRKDPEPDWIYNEKPLRRRGSSWPSTLRVNAGSSTCR